LRGGAFMDPAEETRSAYRYSNEPKLQGNLVGVRPARTFR
jgi:hypothetical protein